MFTSAIAVVLVSFVPLTGLAGITSLLLLAVFTLVNIACVVLRRKTVEHEYFRAPRWAPWLGALLWAVNQLFVGKRELDPAELSGE